ncbi:Alpha/Beta hydrolase protein [Lobosporangium transversale]|uniref:Alpha/Beta hydrolase protein n=1 Tax=Lobosporangium transversale TaxID=64571 RepID=A0A1Y2G6H1_9FUNG|nr:Alpha/Beta hydrolase protein [Lobosporangium transversale]ORY98279.1 Alpha/Beta hydrolase protein [Lobosporangium transversale]|eukprot:XP_021875708.1 Alpha/Beta hydrolase protein [Lobosporangium transversale]
MAQKLLGFLRAMVPRVPLIAATTLNHYVYGPCKPSWSYRLSLTVALMRSFMEQVNHVPIIQTQANFRMTEEEAPVDPRAIASQITIPKSYRDKASKHIQRLMDLQQIDSAKLGWDWSNDPKAGELLQAEWTEMKLKDDEKHMDGRTVLYLHGGGYILCSILTHRCITSEIARLGGAKVLSIDYRLAPESPFPAALVDAIAAYLYLLYPPAGSGVTAIDPKNVVIMGDSAGGGLTFGTMLALRDAGLPLPGGVVGLSPWLDLLHSMPSLLTNNNSDYLPEEGFTQGGQGSLGKIAALAATLDTEDNLLNHPELPEIQYYATNALLACPYVSPLVADNLEGTCPMLVIAGDGELLRDEAIVFAAKNANASPILHLLVYDDMPHVFPMFNFLPSAADALERAGQFIRSVTCNGHGGRTLANKSSLRVCVDGRERPLEQDAVRGWESRVGKLGGGQEVLKQLCESRIK